MMDVALGGPESQADVEAHDESHEESLDEVQVAPEEAVEAEEPGVVLKTLVPPGAQVEVGAPIAVLGDPGEQVADVDALLAELGVTETSPAAAVVPKPARKPARAPQQRPAKPEPQPKPKAVDELEEEFWKYVE